MNRIYYSLVLMLALLSCQTDDIKNTYTIKGVVGIEEAIPTLDQFTVLLISNDQIIATSSNQEFEFTNLEEGKSYTVRPQSLDESKNGVSTLDWVLIDKYIIGEATLDPFQKLAADVNQDHLINYDDKERIRLCILGTDCFSWRFASHDYDGISTGYADQFIITNLVADQEVNFVPIKLGDLNNTIRPH